MHPTCQSYPARPQAKCLGILRTSNHLFGQIDNSTGSRGSSATISGGIIRTNTSSGTMKESGTAKPEWAGVWGIWGGESYSTSELPWLKGSVIAMPWRNLEPSNSSFNFSRFDNAVNKAINNGQFIMYMVYIDSPAGWVWNNGVPRVITTSDDTYPYYLDPDCKYYVQRLWTAIAEHVDAMPAAPGIICPELSWFE